MNQLHILLIENDVAWQTILSEELSSLGNVTVHVAATYDAANRLIFERNYDLALVDLSLSDTSSDSTPVEGMGLLGVIRGSEQNSRCGLIVLTAWATKERMRQGFVEYDVDDFIEKRDFEGMNFLKIARSAIMDGRLRLAAARESARYCLDVMFNSTSIVGCKWSGPQRQAEYRASSPVAVDTRDLARRGDNLNLFVLKGGPDVWRPEASSLGQDLYRALSGDKRILSDLSTARAHAERSSDLWLRFSGPAEGLGIPFELLRDEDDYFALDHTLTRRIIRSGSTPSRKPESFRAFIEKLWRDKRPLRYLLVGSNSDGRIPSAEAEAQFLATVIAADLERLGINHQISVLSGSDASYENVRTALADGRYHMFHYAGHGRHDDKLPEISGLVLRDGSGYRTMTSDVLGQLAEDTELRSIYLSCCLCARTSGTSGRGDFLGVLDALVKADVPTILGYRWTVSDDPAMMLAAAFYEALWETFSPGQALLQARRQASTGRAGRDDETWASPVLVTQTN